MVNKLLIQIFTPIRHAPVLRHIQAIANYVEKIGHKYKDRQKKSLVKTEDLHNPQFQLCLLHRQFHSHRAASRSGKLGCHIHAGKRDAVPGIVVVMTTVNSSFVRVAREHRETEGFTLNANEGALVPRSGNVPKRMQRLSLALKK